MGFEYVPFPLSAAHDCLALWALPGMAAHRSSKIRGKPAPLALSMASVLRSLMWPHSRPRAACVNCKRLRPSAQWHGKSHEQRKELGEDAGKPPVGVAKAIQFDPHPVHDREIQTAGAAVLVALIEEIQDAAALQRAGSSAGEDDRELIRSMSVAIVQTGGEHQYGAVKERLAAF